MRVLAVALLLLLATYATIGIESPERTEELESPYVLLADVTRETLTIIEPLGVTGYLAQTTPEVIMASPSFEEGHIGGVPHDAYRIVTVSPEFRVNILLNRYDTDEYQVGHRTYHGDGVSIEMPRSNDRIIIVTERRLLLTKCANGEFVYWLR